MWVSSAGINVRALHTRALGMRPSRLSTGKPLRQAHFRQKVPVLEEVGVVWLWVVVAVVLAAVLMPMAIYDRRSRARGRRSLHPAEMKRQMDSALGRPEASFPTGGNEAGSV